MSINVIRSNDDPFYRYKMPPVIAKVEGAGNGIKTVVPNMSDIAKALGRPPSYPTKYFGVELGAQTKMDDKNDRYIINGEHDASHLQDLLDGFIEKFVLCPQCKNPETRLSIPKKKTLHQQCVACGYQGNLKSQHKLLNYIFNHPPPITGTGAKKQSKAKDGEGHEDGGANNDIEMDAPDMQEVVDDGEWATDTSKDAQRRREQQQLSSAVRKLAMTSEADLSTDDKANIFFEFVKERKDIDPFPSSEVLDKVQELEIPEPALFVLVEVLLDIDEILPAIKTHQALFQHITNDRPKLQRRLLSAFEILIVSKKLEHKQIVNLLNAVYQLDIVEEDAIRGWFGKPSKKFVKKSISKEIRVAAKPFIDWLDQEEEEDDDDDDEEEDEEDGGVVFNTEASVTNEESGDKANDENNDEDDDIDIDDI
eukprot:m.9234 g.9234  ORF g.9234 m.9234 type:complete len:423 (-) comp6308_c0_seq1:108-1376(-)